MEPTMKNEACYNLVNYQTQESNIVNFVNAIQSSADPTSLSFLTANNLIVNYEIDYSQNGIIIEESGT